MKINFYERGSGQPLIFLHGVGSTGRSWQAQLERFGESYHAIALDLPGYGGSEALPPSGNTFPALADWLKHVITMHQWEQPILIGNSYGGMIVQEFLARHPGIAKAVVLFGTSPAFGKKDGEWQQNYIRARLKPLDEGKSMADLAPKIAHGLSGSGALPEGIAKAIKDIASVSNDAFRTGIITLLDFDQRKNLGQIDIPCLLLVGAEDSNAPPKMMKKMSTYIPGAQFIELPALGHIAHVENPPIFNGALEKFLASFSPPRKVKS